MLYRVVKLCGTFLLQVFFRDIIRRGAPLCEHGPLLIVANHPNFLFDPALLGRLYRRPLWFLAKSTLFSVPLLSAVMRALHMVPVYRRQDSPDDVTKNKETFAKAAGALHAGRALAIFPEGVSLGLRRLSPMKTGAARIALQAESELGFAAGLHIQPIGFTYADMREFQTTVTVYAGEPIPVARYQSVYEKNPKEAVRVLTNDIETALRAVTVEVSDDMHRELVDLLGKLYSAHGYAGDDRALLAGIARHVEVMADQHAPLKTEILLKLRWYVSLANALHLDPGRPRQKRSALFLPLAVPFVLFGALYHWLPYRLVGFVVTRRRTEVETATMKLLLGTVFFLLWYLGTALLLWWLGLSQPGVAGCIVILLTTGYLALRHVHSLLALMAGWLVPGAAQSMRQLEELSDELFATCEKLRAAQGTQ